jgi:peptidoglycan/LPS O-acetylase OafA/YrhL
MTLQERFVATSFRGPGFDLIRFVAAIVVLIHHCSGLKYADIRVDPLFHYSGGFIHFGFLAVVVFFIIGGFLVTPSLLRSENMVDFASRRIIRIFPALIVVVIASMVVLGPILTTLPLSTYFTDPKLYFYAKNLLTLTYNYLPGVMNKQMNPIVVNGALWILHFLLLSYAALALTAMLGILRRRNRFMILFLVSYGIYLVISLDPTLVTVLPNRLLTFIKVFVYFAAGATLYIFSDRVPFSKTLAIGAFALVVVALPFSFGAVVMPLCLPYIIVFCGFSALPGRRLLKHDLSYGVYLIHCPILVVVILVFPNFGTWWLAAMVVFLITLVLSYLCWTFVEEPALRGRKELLNWLTGRFLAFYPLWSKRN